MSKGKTYPHERIPRKDPVTGRTMMQLASFPTTSINLPHRYRSPNNGFTCDGEQIVFIADRSGDPGAPKDLFRVNRDGSAPTQLTERDTMGGVAVSGTRRVAYFYDAGDLFSVDLDTFAEEHIGHVDVGVPEWGGLYRRGQDYQSGVVTPDDAWYFLRVVTLDGERAVARFATDGSRSDLILVGAEWNLHNAMPDGSGLMVLHTDEHGERWYKRVDYSGEIVATYGRNVFAHTSPLGNTGKLQGCAQMPERAVIVMGEGDERGERIADGPYFWHSSASLDGEWIVADTNWPNEGIFLICVKTRRSALLVHPGNSGGHPQWTHAHPFFSPDMKYVVFNSDRTGTGQPYIIEIPEDLLAELED